MKIKQLSLVLISISLLVMTCIGAVHAAEDTQLWNEYTVDAKVNDKLTLRVLNEMHFTKDVSDFTVNEIYIGPIYKLMDRFSTGIFYKNVQTKSKDIWSTTNRIVTDLYISGNVNDLKYYYPDINWWDIKINRRNRMEYNATKGTWLYRDKTTVSKDYTIAKRTYTPFIASEFFIDLNDNFEFNQNRSFIGVTTDFIFGTKIGVYYMGLTNKKNNNWTYSNVIGTSLHYKF